MRYLQLLLSGSLLALGLAPIASAQDLADPKLAQSGVPVQIQTSSQGPSVEFWQSAQKILQSQINLIDRLDRAIVTPDPNAVRAISGRIITHAIEVRRLSSGQYGNGLACPKGSVTDSLDVQIICQIQANAKILEGLQPALQDRIDTLGNVAYVQPLPLVSGESIVGPGGVPRFEKGSLARRAAPLYANAPNLPVKESALPGRPVKSALGDYVAPLQPALMAPLYVANMIDRLQNSVSDLQSIFPKVISFSQPNVEAAIADRRAYGVDPQDINRNKSFLEKPHTGLSRVHPSLAYNPDPNILRNRLAPSFEERHPYALLINPSDPPLPRLQGDIRDRLAPQDTQRFPFVPLGKSSFRPRLALQLNGNEFKLVNSGFDYGFMMDLGNLGKTDINGLSAGLPSNQIAIEPDIRSFFLGYRPPTTLEALKSERHRFLSGKAGPNNMPSLLSPEAPIQMGHTYLLRTLQFKMPDAIGLNKALPVQERRKLDQVIAELKSKDLLVVFRPIERKADGSYSILWRVMGEFAEPQVSDLAQYIQFDN